MQNLSKSTLQTQKVSKNQVKAKEKGKVTVSSSSKLGFFAVRWTIKGKNHTVFSKSLFKITQFFMGLKSKCSNAKLYYFPANGDSFREVGRCVK